MKKRRWILSLGIAAVMLTLLLAAVGGTLAFLIAETDSITNVFELGDITYKLILEPNPPEGYTVTDVTMPKVTPDELNLTDVDGSKTIAAGSVEFTLDEVPTLTGYAFLGWYDENDIERYSVDKALSIEVGYNDENPPTETDGDEVTKTLYAQWKRMDFTVSFDPNAKDATVDPTSKTVTYQQAYGNLPVPHRDKYKFIGWTYTPDSTDTNYVTDTTIVDRAEDHTLYAQWVGDHVYLITYYANASNASFAGNKQQVTDTKVQDTTYTVKSPTELSVTRNGYVWTEWNTKPDGTGDRYLGESLYTTNSDLTLYAIWATETEVTFGTPDFVNMGDPKYIPGSDSYNFSVTCKTQSGADGIAIPINNLIPGEAYRLTFSVTFNDFKFYRDDDGDYYNKSSTEGSYIFGTNIIDQYKDYDTKLSIISQKDKKTTSKYENMQWSTINGGHYEVFLDFVPTSSTMYWFWETTDILDGELMKYEFNNFNIQNRGPTGPRVEFEDLTVTFQTAPFIDQTVYTWPNATNGTVRHKNYFHTEKFGFNYLEYRVFGYEGYERMTIPITGLTEEQWYELSFTQDLSDVVTYSQTQVYGCAVSDTSSTADNMGNTGCVDMMPNYKDLRKIKVGDHSSSSIKFKATDETMYWHWTLGDLQDRIWNSVKLSNVTLVEIDEPTAAEMDYFASSPEVPVYDENSTAELPENVFEGKSYFFTTMPEESELEEDIYLLTENETFYAEGQGWAFYGWLLNTGAETQIFTPDLLGDLDETMFWFFYDNPDAELSLTPLYEELVWDTPEEDELIVDVPDEDNSEGDEFIVVAPDEDEPEGDEFIVVAPDEDESEGDELIVVTPDEDGPEGDEFNVDVPDEDKPEGDEFNVDAPDEDGPEGNEFNVDAPDEDKPEGDEFNVDVPDENNPKDDKLQSGDSEEGTPADEETEEEGGLD